MDDFTKGLILWKLADVALAVKSLAADVDALKMRQWQARQLNARAAWQEQLSAGAVKSAAQWAAEHGLKIALPESRS
jgi:hypothetical protein